MLRFSFASFHRTYASLSRFITFSEMRIYARDVNHLFLIQVSFSNRFCFLIFQHSNLPLILKRSRKIPLENKTLNVQGEQTD